MREIENLKGAVGALLEQVYALQKLVPEDEAVADAIAAGESALNPPERVFFLHMNYDFDESMVVLESTEEAEREIADLMGLNLAHYDDKRAFWIAVARAYVNVKWKGLAVYEFDLSTFALSKWWPGDQI